MIDLIIPIYNAEKTLDLTLMSIKMQTIIDKINDKELILTIGVLPIVSKIFSFIFIRLLY